MWVKSNNDAQHCENLKKDMEKSQRTVKVLDMPVEDSITNGKIENMNAARDNVKKRLKTNWTFLRIHSWVAQYRLTPDQSVKAIPQSQLSQPIKIKKISIEKALRAASKKVVVKWPSYLYSHIKEIRKGYANKNSFKDSQVLIRPSASNNKLVISTRSTSNDQWNYIETLNFPLNPSYKATLQILVERCRFYVCKH